MTIKDEIDRAKASELITVRQLAILSQYDPQTIYRKAKRGEIPGVVRYGRAIRFVRVVALAWNRDARSDRHLAPSA